MKKYLICAAAFVLAACSSSPQNLAYSTDPILNIDANLAPYIESRVSTNSAWVKNNSTQWLDVNYHLYWYDAQGITQVWQGEKESFSAKLHLQPQEKRVIELRKPTPESVNYRLYLQ